MFEVGKISLKVEKGVDIHVVDIYVVQEVRARIRKKEFKFTNYSIIWIPSKFESNPQQ